MCRPRKDLRRPTLFESHYRVRECTSRVHHIVDKQTRPTIYVTDHVSNLGLVGSRAPLVDDGKRGVEPVGEPIPHLRRPDVGCNHDQVGKFLLPEVSGQNGRRIQVVHRDVKKCLNLMLVEVHPDHPVSSGCGHEIRHQFCADRHTRLVFSVLPSIAEVGDDRRHPSCRSTLRGVDQKQQFQDRIRRSDRRLNDEYVSPTSVIVDPHENFAVSKVPD